MSQASAVRHQELEDAFQAFNQLSAQLSESYAVLEGRVAQLTRELAEARGERLEQLTQKERLANRLSALLQALPAGVVVLDGRGIVQDYNAAALSLLGEPLRGVRWSDVIDRAFAPRPDDGQDLSLRNGRRINLSTCPLGTEPGQILLLVDVTETRCLQDQLNQHQRLAVMGEMAASLAHQVRTPLASALLYTSHLKRPQLADEDRARFADKSLSRLRHLERLVNDMLLYARGGTAGAEVFSVHSLLAEMEQILEPQLQASATRLSWHDATDAAELYANREMVISALQNLTTNAMQAMGSGGELTLAAEYAGAESIDLLVHDNGPGIHPEHQATVFDPFFTTRGTGTGLGLAVVAATARAHHGEVWLRSVPGEGCTFAMRLPLHNARGTTQVVRRASV